MTARKFKPLAQLTVEEEKVWQQAFGYHLDSGKQGQDRAGARAWRDVQKEFPRLKDYRGALPTEAADLKHVPVISDAATRRRVTRYLGTCANGRRTRVELTFDILTPLKTPDPAVDEVLLLDLVDHVSFHLMDAHDVPGFELSSFRAGSDRGRGFEMRSVV
jgi:hypothetical protein